MKTVAFIPIKLNNQRLPGKNLLPLNGKPMCEYLFETLADVKGIDEKYVYCSDETIKNYMPSGLKFLKRDSCLDGFQVKGLEIIDRFVKDIDADIYIITHVTQPFTKKESFETALEKVKSGDYDSAFSAVVLQDYMWTRGKPFNYDMKDIVTTQHLEPIYMETGAFFIFRKEVFTKLGQRIGENPYIHVIDQFEAVDVDTAEDFEFAKAVAKYFDAKNKSEKNVRLLDCTLRDGGRIIDCAFPDEEIKDISARLADSKIDIIEVGFLRDGRKIHYSGNSTFFTDVDQIAPLIDKTKNAMYVAFIDYGMFDFDSLKRRDGNSIDGIRLGFTHKNYSENRADIVACMKKIKSFGYKLFVQGVNSLGYSDKEILELVELMNEVKPYSFGIVDTYGAMYQDDVQRIFRLIDNNMNPEICINFHSHNNYQLSFSFAQEMIRLANGKRKVIIDCTLNGMGKVAGNLNTELIVDYLARKKNSDYDLDKIFDLIDDRIYKYAISHKWGYSIPAMMAGIYKSHPNNVIYLTEKFRLETKDISRLLSMISPELRERYDYANIEKLYVDYVAEKIDDDEAIKELACQISGKEILVLAPGNSLNTQKKTIDDYILKNSPIVISVNFVFESENSFAFFGNQKRFNKAKIGGGERIIVSSNIKTERKVFLVNYNGVINRNFKYFENSTIMLLNLLKKLSPKKIAIAGFDGFDKQTEKNYIDASFQNERHVGEFDELNKELAQMYTQFAKAVDFPIEWITDCNFDNSDILDGGGV